jgi:poly(glycerol-phosphate) alpha-glucosyltransferase
LREWSLTIAGWDQRSHEAELRALVRELGVADDVRFAGPMFGDDKTAALFDADAVALPSLSEGMPMVVLEAWAHGRPVLMTTACNLPEGASAGAAVIVDPGMEDMAEGLAQLVSMSDGERTAMGQRGRDLVERQFSWPKIAAEMLTVYRWVVGGGARPQCIVEA